MKKHNASLPLLTSLYLFGLVFFSILITTGLFVVKIPIGIYNIPLSCIASALVCYFFSEKSLKKTTVSTIIGMLVVVAAVIACFYIYDWSWDGNTYHKSMLAFMKNGWNPMYETFYDFADRKFQFLSEVTETWYDAYPKGTEIWAACIYAITGNIETGKSYNLIITVAAILAVYVIVSQIKQLEKWQTALCSVFFIINPVSFSQMFTYYNDGFLWQLVFVCIAACLYLTFFENQKYTFVCYYLIFLTINIGFNTKFSSIIFFGLPCGFVFLYWCFIKWKEGLKKEEKSVIVRRFLVLAFSVISAVCFTGATSYVTNTIKYMNPVYTMIGSGSTDIMGYNTPNPFKNMSNFASFIGSLFARSNGRKDMTAIEWKIPFTFDAAEFEFAQSYDIRTSGWGILFSGIFIISLIVLAFAFRYFIKRNSSICNISILFAFIGILSILFVPSMWWARYCVGLFFLPVCAMMYLFVRSNSNDSFSVKRAFCAGLIVTLLLFNLAPNISKTIELFKEHQSNQYQLGKLKAAAKTSEISVSGGKWNKFYGRIFTLYDLGITDFTYDENVAIDYSGKVYEAFPLYYKTSSGVLSTKNIKDFLTEYEKTENTVIMISAKDEATAALTEDIVAAFRSTGLEFDLKNQYRCSYLAVVDSDEVIYEEKSNEKLEHSFELNGKQISMSSAGYLNGNVSSIEIDGQEYSRNKRGINIIIYDKESDIVIDSITVDTYLDNSLAR